MPVSGIVLANTKARTAIIPIRMGAPVTSDDLLVNSQGPGDDVILCNPALWSSLPGPELEADVVLCSPLCLSFLLTTVSVANF